MITTKDHRWINLAKKFLNESNHSRYRFVCVLVKGGRLINYGVNKSSPVKFFVKEQRSNQHLHAEVAAILNLTKAKSHNTIAYIYGETIKGNPVISSKPCKSCALVLQEMNIKRIVYMDREIGLIEE